jgi:hypothetical protein
MLKTAEAPTRTFSTEQVTGTSGSTDSLFLRISTVVIAALPAVLVGVGISGFSWGGIVASQSVSQPEKTHPPVRASPSECALGDLRPLESKILDCEKVLGEPYFVASESNGEELRYYTVEIARQAAAAEQGDAGLRIAMLRFRAGVLTAVE